MQGLVIKFLITGELRVDLFSTTFAVVKVCLKFVGHCRFVSCKVATECFAERRETLFEMYVRRVLKGKPGILGSDEVLYDCMMMIRELEKLQATKPMKEWKVSTGSCSAQIITAHTIFFLSNILSDPS